jgi:hypothetical protein
MRVERVGAIETSPARQMFYTMWAEKMSASARLTKIVREGSPAEKEWEIRRKQVEPAVRIEISQSIRSLPKG